MPGTETNTEIIVDAKGEHELKNGSESSSSLRYDYSLDSLDESSHYGRLLNRVGRHKTVLELGSSTGFLTEAMIGKFGCTVTAVEVDEDAAAEARAKGHEVFVLDLDHADLTKVFSGRRFDVVFCADVLEHLRNPEAILAQLKGLLADGGYVICSIPHVAHGDIRLSLLTGRLPYRPMGLLDHTHIKFFTRALLEEMFEGAGLRLESVERNLWQTTRTEVQGRMPAALAGLRDFVAADLESETYQFIVKAVPYGETAATAKLAPQARVDLVVIDQDFAVADDLYQRYLSGMHYPPHQLKFWFAGEGGALALVDRPKGEPAAYGDSDFRTFRFASMGQPDCLRTEPAVISSQSEQSPINRRGAGINVAATLAQVARGSDAKYIFVLLASALPGANCLAELVEAAESFSGPAAEAPLLGARPELRSGQSPRATADGLLPWHEFSALLIPRDFLVEAKSIDPSLWTIQAQAADMCFRAWACGRPVREVATANYFSNGPTLLPGDYDDTVADGLRLRRRWGGLRNIVAFARYSVRMQGRGQALVWLKTINHIFAALALEVPLRRALTGPAPDLVGFTGPGASEIGRA